jgi:hypothetical protein
MRLLLFLVVPIAAMLAAYELAMYVVGLVGDILLHFPW